MRFIVLFVALTAVILGACRREEAAPIYEPMKLGGQPQQGEQR